MLCPRRRLSHHQSQHPRQRLPSLRQVWVTPKTFRRTMALGSPRNAVGQSQALETVYWERRSNLGTFLRRRFLTPSHNRRQEASRKIKLIPSAHTSKKPGRVRNVRTIMKWVQHVWFAVWSNLAHLHPVLERPQNQPTKGLNTSGPSPVALPEVTPKLVPNAPA